MDGGYYDVQVSNVLKNGVPLWSNLPMAYYLLAPFVAISKSSILGIKIGISFYGSIMVFPAYFICKNILSENSSKVLPLLAAFLMVVNTMYFNLIGDFNQNLIGTSLFLIFLYIFIKWLNDITNKKYALTTIILICINLFTHIYTGVLTVTIFLLVFILSTIIKIAKIKKMPVLEIKIVSICIISALAILPIIFLLYPAVNEIISSFLTSLSGKESSSQMMGMGASSINYILTIPFILGLIVTLKIFIAEFKNYLDENKSDKFSKKGITSVVYLTLSSILIVFSLVQTEFQMRFGLLIFIVIAFLSPLSLYLLEDLIRNKYPLKKHLNLLIIGIIAILFISSSVYTASGQLSRLSPSITDEQYNGLFEIKEKYLDNITHPAIILVDEYHGTYWTQYVFNQDIVTSDNQSTAKEKYNESNFFKIEMDKSGMGGGLQFNNKTKPILNEQYSNPNNEFPANERPHLNDGFDNITSNGFNHESSPLNNNYSNNNFRSEFRNMNLWNPFFPYPFLIGFDLFNNMNKSPDLNNHSFNETNVSKNLGNRVKKMFGFTKSDEEINGTLLFYENNIKFYKLDLF
ncbi:MAG: glycosyltransferase family 39 protein [Methanobrevibacter sp.]|jgi:hypothetical protein|nr:glycosyltransferase family 39 protein [Candidatus Methanovirga basalitermitum]